VISKKVAKKAHDRNRLKRRLREVCRQQFLPRMRKDLAIDLLIAARSAATAVDYARLAADVDLLGRQAGLL
jgi:ribonuclease P protein component